MVKVSKEVLEELGIDEALYAELLDEFILQLNDIIEKLSNDYSNNDLESLKTHAHFIKGSAANIRINNIYETTKEIEALAKHGTLGSAVSDKINTLKQQLEELKTTR